MSDKGEFGHLDLGFRFIESPKPIDPADYGPQKVDTKAIDERNRRIADHIARSREHAYSALGLHDPLDKRKRLIAEHLANLRESRYAALGLHTPKIPVDDDPDNERALTAEILRDASQALNEPDVPRRGRWALLPRSLGEAYVATHGGRIVPCERDGVEGYDEIADHHEGQGLIILVEKA